MANGNPKKLSDADDVNAGLVQTNNHRLQSKSTYLKTL
jgi:hypothetical protein